MKNDNLSDKLSSEITKHWNLLKNDLYNGKTVGLSLNEIIEKYTFFKVFDDLVNNMSSQFSISLKELGNMYRGVGVNEDIELSFYQRMIPNLDYAKTHNRMNPPGEAFIYLGVIPVKKNKPIEIEKKFIQKTIEAELRVNKGDYYTIAKFESASDKSVFDLVGNPNLSLNINELSKIVRKQSSEKYSQTIAFFYFNLFNNDQILKPVNSSDNSIRAMEYAPFQLLATYFKSKGFAGIKYRSTVHYGGTNIVIFDPKDVKLVESSMERIIR